jgi:hypothetical protein
MFEEVFHGRYSHARGQRKSTTVIYASFLHAHTQVIALNVLGLLAVVSTPFLEDSPRRRSVSRRMQPDKQKITKHTNNVFVTSV